MNINDIRLVSRTHFRKQLTEDKGWQWFWSTMTPDEADIVGTGGEGYHNLQDSINGFISQQGVPEWEPGQPYPKHFRLEKIDPQHYVIMKFAKVENKETKSD